MRALASSSNGLDALREIRTRKREITGKKVHSLKKLRCDGAAKGVAKNAQERMGGTRDEEMTRRRVQVTMDVKKLDLLTAKLAN